MSNWWLNELTVTDRTNIVCFIITIAVCIGGLIVAIKMKLPCWKFQVGWIVLMIIFSIFLLTTRLMHG